MTAKRWYSTGDLAQLTDLSIATVRRDIALNELRATRRKSGRHYRIEAREARRYVEAMGCRWPVEASPGVLATVPRPADGGPPSIVGISRRDGAHASPGGRVKT